MWQASGNSNIKGRLVDNKCHVVRFNPDLNSTVLLMTYLLWEFYFQRTKFKLFIAVSSLIETILNKDNSFIL